jgi:hypothetical protein
MVADFDSSLYLWKGTLEPVGVLSSYFEKCLYKSSLQTFPISHVSLVNSFKQPKESHHTSAPGSTSLIIEKPIQA